VLLVALRIDSDPGVGGFNPARSQILRLLARVLRGRLEASPTLNRGIRLTPNSSAERIGQTGSDHAEASRRRRIRAKTTPRGRGMPNNMVTMLAGSGMTPAPRMTEPVPPTVPPGVSEGLINQWFDSV